MTADHPTPEERYAAVLAEHATCGWDGVDRYRCRCGDALGEPGASWLAVEPPHRAHVAAALVAADPAPAQPECRCQITGWTRDPAEPHIPTQPEWEQADDCPVHPLAPAQPDAALSDGEALAIVKRACDIECRSPGKHTGCSSHEPYRVLRDALLRNTLAARAAQPVPAPERPRCHLCGPGYWIGDDGCRHSLPAPEVSREVAEALTKAEALREAADEWERLCTRGHPLDAEVADRIIPWHRERADRIVRDALPAEGES